MAISASWTTDQPVFCFSLRVPVSELAPVAACRHRIPRHRNRLFRPASPPRPLSGLPRLEQEFEAFRQAAYWKAMHGRALQREAQLKVENERLQALLRLREQQLFGRKTETSAATAPAASDAPTPTHRHDSRVASNAVGPVRNAAIIPTSLPLSKTRSCRPTVPLLAVWSAVRRFPRHRGFHNLEIDVRAHRRVIAVPLSTDLLVWCSSGIVTAPPRTADSQEHAGDLDMVTVLLDKYLLYRPTYRLWRTGADTAGPVVGHPDRRPEADGAAVGAGVRGLGEAEQGQRLWHADETRWLVRCSKGRSATGGISGSFIPARSDIHPGGRAVARRDEEHLGPVEGTGSWWWTVTRCTKRSTRSKAGDSAGVLLGARAARLTGDGAELAGSRSLGDGLGGTDRRIVRTQ